jgi:hypothetical protein
VSVLDFREATVTDSTPETEDNVRPDDATEEAPYGYTKSGRIRKRPIGSRASGGGVVSNATNERLAYRRRKLSVRFTT